MITQQHALTTCINYSYFAARDCQIREHTAGINGQSLISRDLFWTSFHSNPILILVATYFGHEQIDRFIRVWGRLYEVRISYPPDLFIYLKLFKHGNRTR